MMANFDHGLSHTHTHTHTRTHTHAHPHTPTHVKLINLIIYLVPY